MVLVQIYTVVEELAPGMGKYWLFFGYRWAVDEVVVVIVGKVVTLGQQERREGVGRRVGGQSGRVAHNNKLAIR